MTSESRLVINLNALKSWNMNLICLVNFRIKKLCKERSDDEQEV